MKILEKIKIFIERETKRYLILYGYLPEIVQQNLISAIKEIKKSIRYLDIKIGYNLIIKKELFKCAKRFIRNILEQKFNLESNIYIYRIVVRSLKKCGEII